MRQAAGIAGRKSAGRFTSAVEMIQRMSTCHNLRTILAHIIRMMLILIRHLNASTEALFAADKWPGRRIDVLVHRHSAAAAASLVRWHDACRHRHPSGPRRVNEVK